MNQCLLVYTVMLAELVGPVLVNLDGLLFLS